MAVRGPYQITLTTTPQPIDITGQDNRDGTRFTWVCDVDWRWGGEDITGDDAIPGAVVPAGVPLSDAASGTDRYFGYVDSGTATLTRFSGGV